MRPHAAPYEGMGLMRRALMVSLGLAIVALPPMVAAQQAKAPVKAAAYKAPRNVFGQPDLGGYWTNATLTATARPAQYGERLVHTPDEVTRLEGGIQNTIAAGNRSTDPNAPPPKAGGDVGGYNRGWLDPGSSVMRVGGQPRTSLLTTANGQVPPADVAQAPAGRGGAVAGRGGAAAAGRGGAAAAGRGGTTPAVAGGRGGAFDNPENRPNGERCIISFGRNGGPPMLPNGFYNNNYQLVQSRDTVAIEIEMVHDIRVVRIGAKHRTDGVRPYFGDSVGKWEGDTLVVETTNIPQNQAYNGSWQNLTVTEKFTRVAADRMHYQFTIHDPTRWSRDWGGEYEFADLRGKTAEYGCHEGNYALEGILAGARAAEQAAR